MTSQEFATMLHELPSNQFFLCGDYENNHIRETIFYYRELYDTQITIPTLVKAEMSASGSSSSELVSFYLDHYDRILDKCNDSVSYLERKINHMIDRNLRCEDCTLFLQSIEMANAYIIDKISEAFINVGNPNMPFGGCKVVASGNFLKLNPILNGYEDKLTKYSSPHFFLANAFPPKGYNFITGHFNPEYSVPFNQFIECLSNIWNGVRVKSNLNKINKLFY